MIPKKVHQIYPQCSRYWGDGVMGCWGKEGIGVLEHWGVGEKTLVITGFSPITPLPHYPITFFQTPITPIPQTPNTLRAVFLCDSVADLMYQSLLETA